MIKIQKEDFNSDEEIHNIKKLHSNIGAVTSFIGYVRDNNNDKNVQSINLEVYEEMAYKQLKRIINKAYSKWKLIDCLIIHRYGELTVNSKIVLVTCFSEHRKDSFDSCNYIMDYLKKDAPFWKNEFYKNQNEWLSNSN
ncbi:MAG: molybdenum cofactor biosynthesis protein MoaE [Proteobacteria bacterium]|jgi:molybdopterin synthase catalytic subunit|nr:molybdenum cofactor biosynthesis protein MoaE [Pseudomonadota bacterium]